MATYNTIYLSNDEWQGHSEAVAKAAVSPGMALVLDSDGEVAPNPYAGQLPQVLIAIEDALQGKTIDDAYAILDQVLFRRAKPGQRFQLKIASSTTITNGDALTSNGDGYWRAAVTGEEVNAYATETVTTTADPGFVASTIAGNSIFTTTTTTTTTTV